MSVGHVGSGSHHSRSHNIEMINIRVNFLQKQVGEVHIPLHKVTNCTPVRRSSPATGRASSLAAAHRNSAT